MVLPCSDATLGGNLGANQTAGGINPASPVTNFVDYRDATGGAATSSTAFYVTEWRVVTSSTTDGTGVPRTKTITVFTRALTNVSGKGLAPSTTLVAVKANF